MIRLENRPDFEDTLDLLVHEWAHVASWRSAVHHGKLWGECYAKAYRTVWEGRRKE